jgi:hypothetical protein
MSVTDESQENTQILIALGKKEQTVLTIYTIFT